MICSKNVECILFTDIFNDEYFEYQVDEELVLKKWY